MNDSLPVEIAKSVDAALETMHAHPRHILLPFYRRAIYKDIDKAIGQNAHKIKVTLSILAAQHVISYWKIPLFMIEEHEKDYDYWLHIPDHLIEIAKGVINETKNTDVVLKEVSHLSEVSHFTGQIDDSPYYHEWCAFEAALRCVWEALNLGHPSIIEIDENVTLTTTDEELELHADTAMLACLAYTGGSWTPANSDKWSYDKEHKRWITGNRNWYFEAYGVWDRNTSMAITRRQEFWEWWLLQAIDEAWSST